MKKLLTVLIVLFVGSGLYALDLKSVKSGAKDESKKQLTTKLKNVQNEKGPIIFKTGSAVIDVEKCRKTLDAIVNIVNNYPGNFKVQVEGHTDNVGNAKANLNLSQKRAESVVKWLVTEGKLPAARLTSKGFGDTVPLADNKTEAGRNKNRRVDFSIL
jgi:outer membrane protein OmpA-like peptidoglycan-associated protein